MKKDILIFGDSIAYGIGDPLLGGWVDLLKRHVWDKNKNLNVYNFCIDGNSTRDLLYRLSIQSAQTLYDKEAIFIAIGVNDSVFYSDGRNFMFEQEFEDNLDKLIKQAKGFTNKIYLVGLAKVDEQKVCPYPESRSGKSWKNDRIEKFDGIIKNLSQENDVQYIEMFDLLKKEDLFDGLHVNTLGQKKCLIA